MPLQDLPTYNWPVMTRSLFRPHNARIVRMAKHAITEYGHELRHWLGSAAGRRHLTYRNNSNDDDDDDDLNKNEEEEREFRQWLRARAKWLLLHTNHQDEEHNADDNNWPINTLPKPIMDGQALVICAGDKQLSYLKTLIYTVRHVHQSTIPLKIVFRDNQDLNLKSQGQLLQDDNNNSPIQLINLSHYFDFNNTAAQSLRGWNLKAFALLVVPETQLLLVDADVMFLQPPERMFQLSPYQRTGALFFHDRVKPQFYWDVHTAAEWLTIETTTNSMKLSQSTQLQPRMSYGSGASYYYSAYSEQIQEAGMLVIDKRRRILSLWAACLLFGRTDIRKYLQTDHMYGDKEMYWIAFEAVASLYNHKNKTSPTDNYDDEAPTYQFARYYPGVIGGTITNDLRSDITKSSAATKTKTEQPEASIPTTAALCGRLLHFDHDNGLPLWANGGYMLKEDDWHAAHYDISHGAINPIYYIDGGMDDEEFPNPWRPWWRNVLGLYSTLKGQNQVWALHRGLGVECLAPNQRSVQRVPTEMANRARRAIQHHFDNFKKNKI